MHHQPKMPARVYAIALVVCILGPQVFAQSKSTGAGKSPLCTRDNALDMIKQQADLTRTFSNPIRRITVLIRAGDLLWPHRQDKARAVFSEAFDLATEYEKENEQKGSRTLLLRVQVPDQRYIVVRAVAKRDATWAKQLTKQMLKQEPESTRDSFNDLLTAARLLDSANKLIATDLDAAIDLAKASFNYPAGFMLPRFLYQLAGVNQRAADQLYSQALAVYGDKPMREFLYLQAYPFAWRETLNTPIFSYYPDIPANFLPNQSLQRQFVQLILRRAQLTLELPLDQSDSYRDPSGALIPATVHIVQGLIKLEPDVRTSLPDLLPSLIETREKILVTLSVENQKLFLQPGREASSMPWKTFAERLELAQKIRDPNERNEKIVDAVMGVDNESLDSVIEAIDKISDSDLRGHLFEWFYFQRATTAIQQKQFEEAERLTARVEGLEQRAYLHTQIAEGLMNRSDAQSHARDVLEEAITEAKKAGITIFAARTLLTASSLYTNIDLNRSISVLGDAVNSINRLDVPDFSKDAALVKFPERRGRGGHYHGEYVLRFYMPGLDPESAFRVMANLDFDTSLSQSAALTDKLQRALSTLALAEVCLVQTKQPAKPKKTSSRL